MVYAFVSKKSPHRLVFVFCCLLWLAGSGRAASLDELQPRRLINTHTAGLLDRGCLDLETRVYPSRRAPVDGAGITFFLSVGISERLMFGGGYGAEGIVGRGESVKGYPWPGLMIKYRLIEETFLLPAIALGFDWQGFGGVEGYQNADPRRHYPGFTFKSQGLFAAASKNFLLLRAVQLGFHGSVNLSVEDMETVAWPNAAAGMDLGFNDELSLIVEYDLALNQKDPAADSLSTAYGNPLKGYLNAGIRWAFAPAFYI
jgi:hypothetical protein